MLKGGNPVKIRRVPDVVIRRLPLYLRVLDEIDTDLSPIISSQELGERSGVTSGQIRKDLSFFGVFGKQGVGYSTVTLRAELRRILSLHQEIYVGLVGVGNLGQAFIRYGVSQSKKALPNEGLRMVAAFDRDERKIGQQVAGVPIYSVQHLPGIIEKLRISIIILTVPATAAQAMFDCCVESGVKAFLNFAPVKLAIPEGIRVHHADVTLELESLAYYS
ncbi:MAG TPA: redox-sensing transcriptional repressor Rex [Firmicutes bacterium]|nr:redox-sensing transcriptional repressor Rex [Bacillota bacterium]